MLLRYVAARVGSAAVTLALVSLVIFLAIHLVPGGFADIVLGPSASAASKAAVMARLGLDKPLPVQYLLWVAGLLHGDFGTSLITGEPIAAEFVRRIPVTTELTALAAMVAIAVGVPLGLLTGITGGSRVGRAAGRVIGAIGLSVPDFVLGSILVYVFSRYPLGLTVGGFAPLSQDALANLRAILLPALTLSVFGMSLIMRTTRDAVMGVLTEPHITAAVARGESAGAVVRRHVLRNAAIPILTVVTANVGALMGGAVVVELLFSIPGVGRYMLEAITRRDYGVVEAGVMLATFIFIALTMVADLTYALIDPRIGHQVTTR